MNDIFLCYRRTDSEAHVGRIYEYLVREFGKEKIFKDVEDISFGSEFPKAIEKAVLKSDVVLAVIGRDWLVLEDDSGKTRLSHPGDYIRMELSLALQNRHKIKVIPVLVNGATIPAKESLPKELRPLADCNAAPVRADPDFANDMQRLSSRLRPLITPDHFIEYIQSFFGLIGNFVRFAKIPLIVIGAVALTATVIFVTQTGNSSSPLPNNPPASGKDTGTSPIAFDSRDWNKLGDGIFQIISDDVTGEQKIGLYTHQGNVLVWSEKPVDLGSLEFRMQARLISGNTGLGFGPVFWLQDADNYYHFAIQTGGKFRLIRIQEGKPELLIPWTPSELVRGVFQPQNLGVRIDGRLIRLLLEGKEIARYEADKARPGSVGFFAQQPGLSVEFSDVSFPHR